MVKLNQEKLGSRVIQGLLNGAQTAQQQHSPKQCKAEKWRSEQEDGRTLMALRRLMREWLMTSCRRLKRPISCTSTVFMLCS